MSQERFAFFVSTMDGGGAQRVTLSIARGVANRGYEVDLLLVSAEGPYMKLIPDNVNVVDLGQSRAAKTIPGLFRYLRQAKPSAIVCTMEHIGIAALIAKLLAGSKTDIIVGIHNTASISSKELKPLRRRFFYWLIKLLFTRVKFIFGVSKGVVDDFQKNVLVPKEKMRVVYNPVVTKLLKEDMHKPIMHPWLQEKTTPIVLAAGRFVPQKDFATLIRAFKDVVSQQEARLIIIGDGGQREMLTELICELGLDDQVDLPGFIENPYPYMKHSDLFVLSSRFEGFGVVLAEAMACGCPVVSTDCPSGPREILSNGEYGKLVPVGDQTALADAIVESLSKEHDRSRIQERAEFFSEDRIVNEYLAILLAD